MERLSEYRFAMPAGGMASGCFSVMENGKLEGILLRVRDIDGFVNEYLTGTTGQSFYSIVSGERDPD